MIAVREYRERAGFSQTKLAEAIGIKQGTISNWEAGIRNPDVIMLKKLTVILNCTADDLLSPIKI